MENDRHGQRWATWMHWKLGNSGAEISRQLQRVCGSDAPSERTVRNWIQQFVEGRETAERVDTPGRPPTAVTTETISQLEDLIADDPRITVRQMGTVLGIGQSAINTILHEHLHLNKVTARWVPKFLTPTMKRERVENCEQLLAMAAQGGPDFLNKIVTGDESWFHYYEPESKRSSMEWRAAGEAPPVKVRSGPSAGKRMASVFWDREGILLIKWLPEGRTVNSQYYCEVLRELREAIKNMRRGKLTRGVLLQQDNARPHTSMETMGVIQELGFETVPHPPYSPDLAPSDYWLFAAMKRPLKGRRYDNLQQLASAVSKWVRDTPAEFFAEGLGKLPDRWRRCVDTRGDWLEINGDGL